MSGVVDVAVVWGDQLFSLERMSERRAASIEAWPRTRLVIRASTPSSFPRHTFDRRLFGCIAISIAMHAAAAAYFASMPRGWPMQPTVVPMPVASVGSPSMWRPTAHAATQDRPVPHAPLALARERVRAAMSSDGTIGAVRELVGDGVSSWSPYSAEHARTYEDKGLAALFDLAPREIGMIGTGHGSGFGDSTVPIGFATICGCGHGSFGDEYGHSPDSLRAPGGAHGPQLRLQKPGIVGSVSVELVRRVVRRHLSEVRFCYAQALEQNPSLEGRVVVSWMLADGRVTSPGIASSNLRDVSVETCLLSAVMRWTFPERAVAAVSYPFVFTSNE
jgi:hypothetical protein